MLYGNLTLVQNMLMPLHELDRTLCFSAFQCHRSLPTENRPRPSNWCTCSSHLADSTLVYHPPSSLCGLSPPSSTVESLTNATSQWCPARDHMPNHCFPPFILIFYLGWCFHNTLVLPFVRHSYSAVNTYYAHALGNLM